MARATTVSAASVMRNVTMEVRITGVKTLRVRLWLAKRLIRLAAIVAGTKVEIS